MFRPSLSQPTTCLRRPTHWVSRVQVRLAPSVPRRRSSTLSSTLSTVVLDCATSICQRRRAVYGKCSAEYTRGTQEDLNSTPNPWHIRAAEPYAASQADLDCERSSHVHLRNRALNHSSTPAVHPVR